MRDAYLLLASMLVAQGFAQPTGRLIYSTSITLYCIYAADTLSGSPRVIVYSQW